MVLIRSWVQVHKGHVVCDCFNLMASTTMTGMLFVCMPMWIDLEQDMWVYLWIFLLREWEWEHDSNVEIVFLYWNGRFLFLFWTVSLLFSIGLGDLREEVSHYRELKRLQVAATISQSYSRGWCGYQHIARGRRPCSCVRVTLAMLIFNLDSVITSQMLQQRLLTVPCPSFQTLAGYPNV